MKEFLIFVQMFLLGCLGLCFASIIIWKARRMIISINPKILKEPPCDIRKAKILSCDFLAQISCFIFFVVFYKIFGASREFLVASLTFCVLFFHACTDYLAGITFDLATYIFITCLLLIRLCLGVDFFLQGFYSMLVALGVMLLIFIASRGKSGAGDIFVASCLGCGCFSLIQCATCLYLSFLFGAVIGVSLLMTKKITRQTKIPFAPFLFLGYAIGIVLSEIF